VAFPGGYYVSQSAESHTYTDDTDNWVYIDKDDSTTHTVSGCSVTRDEHFIFVECSTGASTPDTPTGTLPLMKVVAASGAITDTDLRAGEIPVEAFANFSTAVDAAANRTLTINSKINLDSTDTVPSTVTLEFKTGGAINLGSYNLTINGSCYGVTSAFTGTGTLTFNGSVYGAESMISSTGTVTFTGSVWAAKDLIAGNSDVVMTGYLDAGIYRVFAGTGTVSGVMGKRTEVLPEWWGAVGGDSTDDAAAIQAAIDYLEARTNQYGTVRLQNNTYYQCDTALTIQEDSIGIQGGNKRYCILQKNFDSGALLTIGQAGDQVAYNFVRDVRLDPSGSSVTVDSGEGVGIDIVNATSLEITDVMSTGFYDNVKLHQDTTIVWMTRCEFNSAKHDGIYAADEGDLSTEWIWRIYIDRCSVLSNARNGITLNNVTDAYITNTAVNSNTEYGISINQDIDQTLKNQNINILNNEVDSNGDYGIFVYRAEFSNISGNWTSNGRTDDTDGILLWACLETTVENNRSVNNGRHGIALFQSGYIQVSNNYCVRNGNTTTGAGISLDTVTYSEIKGNTLHDIAGTQEYALLTAGACTNLVITSNHGVGSETMDFQNGMTADDTSLIADNQFATVSNTAPFWGLIGDMKNGRVEVWGSAAPVAGTCRDGDRVWDTEAGTGTSPGWICTVAGSPGTWNGMANLK
jgi:parallel beta-helix repeat protein